MGSGPQRHDSTGERQKELQIKRTRSGSLRVGCLTWSQSNCDEARFLPASELVRSLSLVAAQRKFNADLILCSGTPIWTDTTADPLRAILAASNNTPVLAEWRDDESDPAEWWISVRSGWEQVRLDQRFVSALEARVLGRRTLREIESGWGVIRFEHAKTALVLLLCNEARILGDGVRSIVAKALTKGSAAPGVFHENWALLHPSHRPYASTSQYRGWGLIGKTSYQGQPRVALFKRITKGGLSFEDGSKAPQAIFHAGSWQPDSNLQERTSGCVFRDGQRYRASHPVVIDGLVKVRYAEFTL